MSVCVGVVGEEGGGEGTPAANRLGDRTDRLATSRRGPRHEISILGAPHEIDAEILYAGSLQQVHRLVDVPQRVGPAAGFEQTSVERLDAHAHPRHPQSQKRLQPFLRSVAAAAVMRSPYSYYT